MRWETASLHGKVHINMLRVPSCSHHSQLKQTGQQGGNISCESCSASMCKPSCACKNVPLVWRKISPGSHDGAATVTSSCRSSPQTQASNCLNSLPSGRTRGISGAAPSAERDPDSLEREDDSLFPACLLELFLSHISSAKSPPFFCLCLYSSQSLTHDLFAPSESTAARSEAPVQTRPAVPADRGLSRNRRFAGDQVQKEAITSTTYNLM